MKFYDYRETYSVLQDRQMLKGSLVSISNDYAKEAAAIRKKIWERGAADKVNGEKITVLNDKIKIDEQMH